MIRIAIFLFLVFFSGYLFSQNLNKLDTTSTTSFVDKMNIKIGVDTQIETYIVNDELSHTNLVLTPNNKVKLSISLNYEFIGISIGFSPNFLPGNDDDALKGASSFVEYGSRFIIGNWGQRLNYSNIQGYYVKNTGSFTLNWLEHVDPYMQFPDLKVIRWSGATSYILNKNFSMRNIMHQTAWQRKSAGSFIPKLSYGYNTFSNIEDDIKTVEKTFDIQIAPGYHYTWVIHRNWYVSSFLTPSLGLHFSNYKEEKNQELIKGLDGGLQIGFSSEKFVFGADINFDVNWYNEHKTTNIIDDIIYAKIYLGYRFKAPKMLQKPVKWINKKIKSK